MITLGVIGFNRGQKLIKILKKTRLNFKITAVLDANKKIVKTLKKKTKLKIFSSEHSFFNSRTFDNVYIASPVKFHARQTITAAKFGFNILCEVPAFKTIKEGKKIKKILKKNKIIYMMAENYCFLPQILALNKLIKKNLFGELTFIRSSYLHDCKKLSFNEKDGKLTWRGLERKKISGNDYPTHSIGPVCKFLNLNQNSMDKLKYITTFANKEASLSKMYYKKFPKNRNNITFKRPDTSCSIIETQRRNMIELICDTSSSRPSSMSDLYIQGTKMTYISGRHDEERPILSSLNKKNISSKFKRFSYKKYLSKYDQKKYKILGKDFGFYKVLKNFHDVIKKKKHKPYIDYNDAYLWSSLIELSKLSLKKGSKRVKI